MNLFESFVRNPVKVSVGVLIVALFGSISLITMPKQLIPAVQNPVLSVETSWPGASPQEIRLAYMFLKEAYKKGQRSLEIGKIRQAYQTLGNPKERRRYDAGKPSRFSRFTRPDGTTPLNSIPLLLALVVIMVGVTAYTLGPMIQSRFVTFDVGDDLYWKETGQSLGTVLELAEAHEFSGRGRTAAYLIDLGAGNEPVWFPAHDLARNCRPGL